MKILITLCLLLGSASSFARKAMWTCYNHQVRYDVDWDSPELEMEDRAYVYFGKQKVVAEVVSMTQESPDIVFYDPNFQTQVLLTLDVAGKTKPMYRYSENERKELITELDCTFNY